MIKIERVLLWLELFNKKYNTDFIISDLNGQKECTYKQFKRYKEKCYSYLIMHTDNIKTISLSKYPDIYNELNLAKLDAVLHNRLCCVFYNKVHSMSLKEKCKYTFTSFEYKIIVKFMI